MSQKQPRYTRHLGSVTFRSEQVAKGQQLVLVSAAFYANLMHMEKSVFSQHEIKAGKNERPITLTNNCTVSVGA